jgi:hypothetical protein
MIIFTCKSEYLDVIMPPMPAKAILPGWFRKLPPVDQTQTDGGNTIKRCMPVLDAMSLGWIIPVPVTLTLEVSDGGRMVSGGAGWVTHHWPYQVAGHHHQPRLPAKFTNHWTIRTDPGWSCLFVPPLDRGSPFECMSAVVDTDRFRAKPVNFPFFWTGPDGVHTVVAGTPMVQVIPFQRYTHAAEIRASTPEEDWEASMQDRKALQEPAGYRRNIRDPRK